MNFQAPNCPHSTFRHTPKYGLGCSTLLRFSTPFLAQDTSSSYQPPLPDSCFRCPPPAKTKRGRTAKPMTSHQTLAHRPVPAQLLRRLVPLQSQRRKSTWPSRVGSFHALGQWYLTDRIVAGKKASTKSKPAIEVDVASDSDGHDEGADVVTSEPPRVKRKRGDTDAGESGFNDPEPTSSLFAVTLSMLCANANSQLPRLKRPKSPSRRKQRTAPRTLLQSQRRREA